MFKILLYGWFIIEVHGVDTNPTQHNYLFKGDQVGVHVYDFKTRHWSYKQNLIHVSASVDKPFTLEDGKKYPENSWIKLKAIVECQDNKTPFFVGPTQRGWSHHYLCTVVDKQIIDEKCTEKNSFVVGGVRYC